MTNTKALSRQGDILVDYAEELLNVADAIANNQTYTRRIKLFATHAAARIRELEVENDDLSDAVGFYHKACTVDNEERLKAEAKVAELENQLAAIEEDGTEEHNAAIKLRAKVAAMAEALEWYEIKVRNCRKLSGIIKGENARQALDRDGGKRARTALAAAQASEAPAEEPPCDLCNGLGWYEHDNPGGPHPAHCYKGCPPVEGGDAVIEQQIRDHYARVAKELECPLCGGTGMVQGRHPETGVPIPFNGACPSCKGTGEARG